MGLGWTLNIVTGVLIRAKRRLEARHRGQGHVYRKAALTLLGTVDRKGVRIAGGPQELGDRHGIACHSSTGISQPR